MKPNKFLTFLFALIPGAGHMYLGYLKRGISIMLLLFFIILCSSIFFIFFWIIPIIWFAAFFDTFKLYNCIAVDEAPKDDYLFVETGFSAETFSQISSFRLKGKMPKYIGVSAICLGSYLFFDILYKSFFSRLIYNMNSVVGEIISSVYYRLPELTISAIIIIIGIKLVKKPKKIKAENFVEYKEENIDFDINVEE